MFEIIANLNFHILQIVQYLSWENYVLTNLDGMLLSKF